MPFVPVTGGLFCSSGTTRCPLRLLKRNNFCEGNEEGKNIHNHHSSSTNKEEEIWRRRTQPSIFASILLLLKILHSTIINTT
jgi:hypothetical protein